MTQLPLPATLARSSDPVSSHDAAAEVVESGRHETQCAAVLAAVTRWPGLTSRELAARMGIDRYTVARRLPTLRDRGQVVQRGTRRCSVGRRSAVTWEAV